MAAKVDADATAPGVFSLKKGKRAFFCVSCNKVHEREVPPDLSPDAEAAALLTFSQHDRPRSVLSKSVVYVADAPLHAAALHEYPVLRDMVDNGSCGPLAQEPQGGGEVDQPAEAWRLEQLLSGFSVPAPGSKPYRGAFLAGGDAQAAAAALELARAHSLDTAAAGSSGTGAQAAPAAGASAAGSASEEAVLARRAAELLSGEPAADVVWVYSAPERPADAPTGGEPAGGGPGAAAAAASAALASADAFFAEFRRASAAAGVSAYQLLVFASLRDEPASLLRQPAAAALPAGMQHLFPRQSAAFSNGEHCPGVTLRGCMFSVHYLPGVVRRDAAVVDAGDPAAWVRSAGRGAVSARQALPELLSRMVKFPKYGA